MKRSRVILSVFVLILGASFLFYYRHQANEEETRRAAGLVEANNQFALDFYSRVKGEEGNIFFSPYSISTAFAIAYEGARGKTADEMQAVFHFSKNDDERRASFRAAYNQLSKKHAKYELNTANALWVQKDYPILKEYLGVIQKHYGGNATNVDFIKATEETRESINEWVEKETKGKIRDLFPKGSIDDLGRLVITNAIYFEGNWVKQFDKNKTTQEDFKVSDDKTVKVPMMEQTDEFNYAETENLQILEMLYRGKKLSMLVLLPKKGDLKSLENSLTLAKLEDWKRNLREREVSVFMPKFTFTKKYELDATLKKMGMPTAFTLGADFSGISGGNVLFVQMAIHQAFVDVNEEGTKAAAAIGWYGALSAVPTFLADHPFIFIIEQREIGEILFIGRVVDPTT